MPVRLARGLVDYDAHTPCPFCSRPARDLYVVARRVLEEARQRGAPEHLELYRVLEIARPYYEAHYKNQTHALSPKLAGLREPGEPRALNEQQRAMLPIDARD